MTQMLALEGLPPNMAPLVNAMLHTVYGWTIRCVQVLADAGVFDALGDAPETAEALAARTKCNSDALERMMRLLASVDIFERLEDGRYRHSALSNAYRTQGPANAAGSARLQGSPLFLGALRHLDVTLRTGGPSLPTFAPEGMWAYYEKHPEEARVFDAAMSSQSIGSNVGVLAGYDFSGFGRIADIGGGQGRMLAGILEKAPSARAVLFDLPEVVASAPAHPRLEIVGGSFLSDPLPTGCDCTILKFVLHDWPDDKARDILVNVRKSVQPGAKLLVIETVRPDTPDFHPSKIMNVSMMALFGGKERSAEEFEALFAETGFKTARVVRTPLPLVSIVEANAI